MASTYCQDLEEYIKPFMEYIDNLDSENSPQGIPTQAGAALAMGISKSAISDWKLHLEPVEGDPVLTCENVSQFKDLISKLGALQEVYTLHRGLTNQYNATIGKLVLAGHGYADKVDNISSGWLYESWRLISMICIRMEIKADKLARFSVVFFIL